MAEKVTIEEKNNLYNKVVNVLNQMIPGQMLDLPVASTITKQQVQYNIRDNEGNIVETLNELPEGYKEGRRIYKNEDGSWTYSPTSKVSLDESTGKITVTAPDFILERDGFKDQFGPQLETLSRYYRQSPTAVIQQSDGSTKTIPQIINELNDPESKSSLASYTKAVLAMQDQELGGYDSEGNYYEGDRKAYNISDDIKLDDNYFMLRNTIALGDDVNEQTLQAVPKQLAQADFLRALESYDDEYGTVKRGDLLENAYNRDIEGVRNEDERLKQLKAGLEEYFAQGDYSDTDEFARCVALYQFITHQAPNAKWYQTAAYAVSSFVEGAGSYFVDLGGLLMYGYTAPEAYQEWVISGIENLARNGKFEGKAAVWSTWGEVVDYWNDLEDQRQMDRLYLSPEAAAAKEIGYGLASLVSLIAMGNAAENIAKGALGSFAAKAGSVASSQVPRGVSAAALHTGGPLALSEGMRIAVNVSNPGTVAKLANIVSAIAGSKAASVTVGLIAETFAEAITGNPDKFYRVLNSGELTDEAKEQLWSDFIGNAVGWAGGVTLGKMLLRFSETTKGRAISMNIARKLAKFTTALGDEWAQGMAKLHGVDDIKDYIKKLNDAGKVEKAQALLARELLREVRRAIADQDAIKVFGRSEEEVLESINELESSLHTYRAFENAIDEFNRRGLGIASEWYNSKYNIKFATSSQAMEDIYESLRKAEKNANIPSVTKAGKLAISQETSNYIAASIKRDIVSSAIKVLEGNPDRVSEVTELKKELEKAEGVISGYTELVGGNQNLLQAADKYTESLKNFYAEANNLLAREGLISTTELEDLRASGLWGENGELYAHFQRITPDNQLSPLRFQGNFRRDPVEYIKSYVHGSDLDYMDPLVTSRLYMRRYADAAARQDVIGQYILATGKGEELLSAADTEAARILNATKDLSQKELRRAVEQWSKEVRAGGEEMSDDLINMLVQKSKTETTIRSTEKKLERRGIKLAGVTKEPLKSFYASPSRIKQMAMSVPEYDINDMWYDGIRKMYGDEVADHGISVYRYVKDNYDSLPRYVKSYIDENFDISNYALGKAHGLPSNIGENIIRTDVGKGRAVEVIESFDTVEGQKFAVKRALERNGLDSRVLSPGAALSIRQFEKKDMRGIRKAMNDIFGKETGDAIIAKAQKAPNGKKRTKDQMVRHLKTAYNEVFLNRDGTAFTQKGERLYLKMIDHQTKTAMTEQLQDLRALTIDNWRAVKKIDPDFEKNLVRRIVGSDTDDTFNTVKKTQEFMREDAISRLSKQMTVYKNDLEELSQMLGSEQELINGGLDWAVDKFVEKASGYEALSKTYDELIDYYGLDKEEAKRYLALRSLVEYKNTKLKNSALTAKGKTAQQIGGEIREQGYAKISSDDKTHLRGKINDAIWKRIEDEYNDLRTTMKEFAPAFVDSDKMYDEVEEITKKIHDYKKDADNIVAIQDDLGRVSFVKTDPLLATMMNHEPIIKPLSTFEKANYLLSKTFRLGTTSLNVKSLINQTFRDFGNAFIGGNLYRTWSKSKTQMAEVLGENVVDWIRRSDSDLADYIVKQAKAAGKAESEVAYETIKEFGQNLAPTTTETAVYKRAAEVSRSVKAAKATGIDKISTNGIEGAARAIDRIGDKFGKLNELREGGLRNLVFQNGFADAVKRGYSFDQAKTYATFLMNNATTNFGRTSVMFSRMQRTVPFLGAAINGTTSFYRLLSVDPVGVMGRLIGGIVIPTAYLTAGSLLTAEDRKTWKNIKEYEKDDNIIFISNGQVFSIPIPQEISAWINPIRHIIEKDADANMHSVMQLAVNDILGLSPIDLDGFANIDASMMADGTDGDGFFVNNIEPGLAKLFSQLAPVPVKAAMMYATGIDPYTMKKIDRSYTTVNLDTGEKEIMGDYSATWVKAVAKFVTENTPFSISAPMAEKMLGSIIGTAPIDYLDWIIGVGDAVVSDKTVLEALDEAIGGQNGLLNMVTGPLTVPQYKTKAEEDWKLAVNAMYDERQALLMSDEWQSYQKQKRNATTAEELSKLSAVRDNLVKGYYSKLQAMVDNLQAKYGADFTAEKYAAVISLSVLDDAGVDSTAYGQYLSDEMYKDAKTRAVDTMYRMGFQSPSDYSVFGYLTTNQQGEEYVAYSTPMSILQLRNNMNYAKNLHQANMRSIIEGRGLEKNGEAYRAMQSQVDAIYAKGNLSSEDYDEISRIYKQWDAQVMTALYPYLKQNGIDNVLENSDTVEFLNDVIKVPSDFAKTKQGRYFSSPGLNKQAGYAKAYIEYVYNLIEEQ